MFKEEISQRLPRILEELSRFFHLMPKLLHNLLVYLKGGSNFKLIEFSQKINAKIFEISQKALHQAKQYLSTLNMTALSACIIEFCKPVCQISTMGLAGSAVIVIFCYLSYRQMQKVENCLQLLSVRQQKTHLKLQHQIELQVPLQLEKIVQNSLKQEFLSNQGLTTKLLSIRRSQNSSNSQTKTNPNCSRAKIRNSYSSQSASSYGSIDQISCSPQNFRFIGQIQSPLFENPSKTPSKCMQYSKFFSWQLKGRSSQKQGTRRQNQYTLRKLPSICDMGISEIQTQCLQVLSDFGVIEK